MAIDFPLPLRPADRVPVLLLGGINLIRTLGHAGIPVVVASTDPDDPVFGSRFCGAPCVLPGLDQGEAALNAIVAIGNRLCEAYGRRVPLMYGSDEWLQLIQRHRERLQRYFLFAMAEPLVAESLLEKDRFQSLGRRRGLPVPRSLLWAGEGYGTVVGHSGAVLVKPRTKVDWYESALRRRLFAQSKALVYEDGPAAAADPALALFHDQLTFQEYVAGGDSCLWSFHGFADDKGVVLQSFVGRKLRTYPPLTGESAFIEIAEIVELESLGRDVALRLPLRGIFKMDFKKDAATGRWHLLEINARFNLWLYLGERNGVNLMRVAYDYLVEGRRATVRPRARRDYRWLALDLDYRAFRILRERGELSAPRWLASILGSRNVYNVFAWDDPGPWLRLWTRRVARRLNRAPMRLLGLVRQWRSTAS